MLFDVLGLSWESIGTLPKSTSEVDEEAVLLSYKYGPSI